MKNLPGVDPDGNGSISETQFLQQKVSTLSEQSIFKIGCFCLI